MPIRPRTFYQPMRATGAIAAGQAVQLNADGTVSSLVAGGRFFGVSRAAIANLALGLIAYQGFVRMVANAAVNVGDNLTTAGVTVAGQIRSSGFGLTANSSTGTGGGLSHTHPSAGANPVTSTVGGTIDGHTLITAEIPAHTHNVDANIAGFARALTAANGIGDVFSALIL